MSSEGKNYSKNNTGKRVAQDFYETPYSLTYLLLESVQFPKGDTILEPASGGGAIVRVLEEQRFRNIYHYDLHSSGPQGTDFLEETTQYDWIITNPPYSISMKFIKKCKEIARKGFALLLPLTYLQGQRRYKEVFSDSQYPLYGIKVFTRYPMLGEPLREDGKFHTGMQAYAWFFFQNSPTTDYIPTIHWLDADPYVLRKEDDHAKD